MLPKFLQAEIYPYASVEIVRATLAPEAFGQPSRYTVAEQGISWVVLDDDATGSCSALAIYQTFHAQLDAERCAARLNALQRDNRPGAWKTDPEVLAVERTIEEGQRRARFQTFLAAPTTGPTLDAMLADNDRIDTELQAERARDDDDRDEDSGSQCGPACGYCGRCS